MNGEGMYVAAGTQKPPRSAARHNLLKPRPSLARWSGAEEEGLNHQAVSFKSPADTPRHARNAEEMLGFFNRVVAANGGREAVAAPALKPLAQSLKLVPAFNYFAAWSLLAVVGFLSGQ